MGLVRFSVEVTLTFDAGPDAFALNLSDAPSVLVQLRGTDLLRRQDAVAAGDQLLIEDVSGIVTGNNEFFVQVTPRDLTSPVARAVRVRVLRDEMALADETLWSEPGEVVRGAVVVAVPEWAGAESAGDGQDDSAAEVSIE